MKVTKFTRSNLPQLKAAMNAALKSVEEQFGISIDLGSCRFRPHGASFKLNLSTLTEDGVDEAAFDNFKNYALLRGFDIEDFGKEFTSNGRQFKIVGWTNRRHRYPIDAVEAHTGRSFKFGTRTVLQALGRNTGPAVAKSLRVI